MNIVKKLAITLSISATLYALPTLAHPPVPALPGFQGWSCATDAARNEYHFTKTGDKGWCACYIESATAACDAGQVMMAGSVDCTKLDAQIKQNIGFAPVACNWVDKHKPQRWLPDNITSTVCKSDWAAYKAHC